MEEMFAGMMSVACLTFLVFGLIVWAMIRVLQPKDYREPNPPVFMYEADYQEWLKTQGGGKCQV